MIRTVKMEKNVTHMITFAKNLVGIANLMKFVMRTQNCVYISATTTTNVKAKIITVTEEILCADQGALQLKIARLTT